MNKLIDLLQPYNIGSKLIRLGKLDDGGYVLPELVLDTCETLYTFGLGDECSFEKDFNQRYKKPIKIFDYGSVFKPNIENTEIIKKNLQTVCNQTGDTIEHAVLTNNDVDKKVLLKIDVEGYELEYFTQHNFINNKNIIGIIIEFHYLDNHTNLSKFYNIINKINESFVLTHLHANNNLSMFRYEENHNTYNIPSVMELSYVSNFYFKKLLKTTNKYPIEGLDYRNRLDFNDHPITFIN